MKPTIIMEGSFRTSADDRQWRIVQKQTGIGFEEETGKDAMGKPIFASVKLFETANVEFVIVRTLLDMWRKNAKLPDPKTPAVILEGKEDKQERTYSWRLVKTDRGIVAEQSRKNDMMNEPVWERVINLDTQCSLARHIFCKLTRQNP